MNQAPPRPLPNTGTARAPQASGSNQRGSACRSCVWSNRIEPLPRPPGPARYGVRLSVASKKAIRPSLSSLSHIDIDPPRSICLLRLSALGDVTHVLPLVNILQRAWPGVAITWIIGKGEQRLLDGLPGVEFIVYDKKTGREGMRALRRELSGREFDALLLMQLALRANLLSRAVRARRRIGYDRARSKELHGLFINERIPADAGHHVLDVLGAFARPLGLHQDQIEWRLPVPDDARDWARAQWPDDGRPTLVISPCSSHPLRNWSAERNAAVAAHAAGQGWRVVLCGGRS